MEKPILLVPLIAASGKKATSDIVLTKCRTLSISARVTYNASATATARVNLYYSADGNNFDTIPYTYFDIDLTAGGTVQETKIIDAPEHGYLKFEVENLDASYTLTNCMLWYSIQSWGDPAVLQRGHELPHDIEGQR